jgi:hypothetical protein
MKQIIGGLTYNTETAELLGTYVNDVPANDFNWYKESLYITKKGRYFIAGEGGAMSPYAEMYGGNSWSYGSSIRSLTTDEAVRWASRALAPDETIALFGDFLEEA